MPHSIRNMRESETLDLAHWAVCYHSNSTSPRARKWYYLGRVIKVDGKWWCLYRLREAASTQFITAGSRDEFAAREIMRGFDAETALARKADGVSRTGKPLGK